MPHSHVKVKGFGGTWGIFDRVLRFGRLLQVLGNQQMSLDGLLVTQEDKTLILILKGSASKAKWISSLEASANQ